MNKWGFAVSWCVAGAAVAVAAVLFTGRMCEKEIVEVPGKTTDRKSVV